MLSTGKVQTRERRLYWKRREKGDCVHCGRRKALPDESKCQKCKDKWNARNRPYAEKRKALMVKLKICVICQFREAVPKRRHCAVCAESRTEYNQVRSDQWKAEGKCPRCGREREEKNRSQCVECRRKRRDLIHRKKLVAA